jgi:hypothetical protein
LGDIQIDDILLETTDDRKLPLRRVARLRPEQARILGALRLSIPERLTPDRAAALKRGITELPKITPKSMA